ncbi:MAG: preprotein translocase subunit SecG [Clostridiales bacterium]|nr:preprotein translocase subunit SecG [Clostridiales bacterium]
MAALHVVVNILLVLVALVLVVVVLMQQGNTQGLGAIGGGAETFLGKNKARGLEGRLHRITQISAGAFIVLAILTTLLSR